MSSRIGRLCSGRVHALEQLVCDFCLVGWIGSLVFTTAEPDTAFAAERLPFRRPDSLSLCG